MCSCDIVVGLCIVTFLSATSEVVEVLGDFVNHRSWAISMTDLQTSSLGTQFNIHNYQSFFLRLTAVIILANTPCVEGHYPHRTTLRREPFKKSFTADPIRKNLEESSRGSLRDGREHI